MEKVKHQEGGIREKIRKVIEEFHSIYGHSAENSPEKEALLKNIAEEIFEFLAEDFVFTVESYTQEQEINNIYDMLKKDKIKVKKYQ